MKEHERFYRDEIGAAGERLAQLEEENARLRDELAELAGRRKRPRAGRRSIAPYLMLATMTLAMLSSLAASGGLGGARDEPAVSSPCRR